MKTKLEKLANNSTNKVVQFVQNNTGKVLTQGQCSNITGALVRGVSYAYELDFCELLISFSPAHSSFNKVSVELHTKNQPPKFLDFLC